MTLDLTKGNPLKNIIIFAFPILLGNIFQQLFQITDTLIVGRLLGVKSLAAVGSSAPIFFMFLIVAFGFTAGLTIITAQCFGANDIKGIKASVFHSFIASLTLTILICLGLLLNLKNILVYMDVPSEIFDEAHTFMFVLGLSIPFTVTYNLLSAFIRALGDSKTPLYFLIFTSVLNIIFNFVFIYCFHWGVAGSAGGTLLSMGIVSLMCFFIIYKKFPLLQLSLKDCKYHHPTMKKHLKIAIPMALHFSILALSLLIIQKFCNSYGTEIIAGFTAAVRIEQISTQPLFALGIAFATYSAQNYGADLIYRIRKGVRQGIFFAFGLSIIITVFVRFLGKDLVSLFIKDNNPNIISVGNQYLLITTYFYFFLSCIFIIRNTLQGMGNIVYPLASSFIELVARIISVYVLTDLSGYIGIFWSAPLAWVCGAIVVFIGYTNIILRLKSKYKKIRLQKQIKYQEM